MPRPASSWSRRTHCVPLRVVDTSVQYCPAYAVLEDPALTSMSDENLLGHATEHDRARVTADIADFAAAANYGRTSGAVHPHGMAYVLHRNFPQKRPSISALVDALAVSAAKPVRPQHRSVPAPHLPPNRIDLSNQCPPMPINAN
jgi:hypothetical protein